MKSHPRIAALLALVLALPPVVPVRAQINLPSLGDAAAEDFGISAERRVGDQIMGQIRRDPAYLDDPLLLDYIGSLWAPLLAAARERGDISSETEASFAWETFLVNDRSVNAFALPGGYVGVHLGLIGMTQQRDELASVLAHELAHVTQRHIARSMAVSQQQSLVGLAALILGMIAASRANNTDMAQAAIVGGQAAMVQGQLNYSRDMEREADRIGFGTFVDAGFAPIGMAGMFEKLAQASRLNDNNAFPYLRSHPLTVERIGEARSRVEALATQPAPPSLHRLEHPMMQARARVLADPTDDGLRRLQMQRPPATATAAERLGVWYGSALAAVIRRDVAAADEALAQLGAILQASPLRERDDPRVRRALVMLEAQVLMARGNAAGAVDMLDGEASIDQRPTMLLRAQAAQLALQAADGTDRADAARQRLRESTEILQTWVAERRQDAAAWQQLAQSAGAIGLTMRSVRADAEARAALGDIPGAIDRLRAGQALAREPAQADVVELAIIDARLRELLVRRRAQLDEQRGNRLGPAPALAAGESLRSAPPPAPSAP